MAFFPGLPGWAGTRKVKPIRILLKQGTVSGSGISWAVCKSASRFRQITTPTPHHSVFLQAGCPSCRPASKHWRQHKLHNQRQIYHLSVLSTPVASLPLRLHRLPVISCIKHKLSTITYKSLSVAQPTYLHLLLQHYQPTRSPLSGSQNLLALPTLSSEFGRQACFQLLHTICLEQVTAIHPISKQFQLIQISFKNPPVCSSLISTVLLPPSDRPRLKLCACLLCTLSSVCIYVCMAFIRTDFQF